MFAIDFGRSHFVGCPEVFWEWRMGQFKYCLMIGVRRLHMHGPPRYIYFGGPCNGPRSGAELMMNGDGIYTISIRRFVGQFPRRNIKGLSGF